MASIDIKEILGAGGLFNMTQLKYALKLELKGIKVGRGQQASTFLRKTYGLKGTKEQLLKQVTDACDEYLKKAKEEDRRSLNKEEEKSV